MLAALLHGFFVEWHTIPAQTPELDSLHCRWTFPSTIFTTLNQLVESKTDL
jgi:hypothetical protein